MNILELSDNPKVAILVKESIFHKTNLIHVYANNICKGCIAIELPYDGKKPSTNLKNTIIPILLKQLMDIKILYVADTEYFKSFVGVSKADPHLGYVMPCKFDNSIQVILGINYQAIMYNPNIHSKLDLSINTLNNYLNNTYEVLGSDIILSSEYPETLKDISDSLDKLHSYKELTCDIEAFSLKHYEAGIGTISFAWDKHNGIAFCCDYQQCEPYEFEYYCTQDHKYKFKLGFGKFVLNIEVRKLLYKFFTTYKGNIKWYNCTYDIKVIIYSLWMKDIIDNVGLLNGLEVMTNNFDDVKIISYLAVNSCAGNILSLKEQSHEFAGNYAESDINDIKLISKENLLKYNLIDSLATWYVLEKNYPIMVKDNQKDLYEDLMKVSLITVIQMELTGMPICINKVKEAKHSLNALAEIHVNFFKCNKIIIDFEDTLEDLYIEKDFNARKNKAKNPHNIKPKLKGTIKDEFKVFNPNSNTQISKLLYDILELPILDTTDKGAPSTKEKTLSKLVNHTKKYKDIINNIIEYTKVQKILSTFIPAMLKSQLGKDGIYYLFGSFNIAGTKSGRLSSSKINLQQLPSNSIFGKLLKECFKCNNPNWLFVGLDFNAMESVVDALITKDPIKIEILSNGYDSHSFNCYTYWPNKFPEVTEMLNNSKTIKEKRHAYNWIKLNKADLRQDSKQVSFALLYLGTAKTLHKNSGFPIEEAEQMYANYLDTYKISIAVTAEKIKQASKDGYVTCAFGLRLRTPILNQVVYGSKYIPYEAQKEIKTASNALGQSYGLLNSRAASEFMAKVRKSKYKYLIKISALIHDAIYLIIYNNLEIVHWVNTNLIECMQWQELPELKHDKVKLGAELDIFYPDWATPITIANYSSKEEIQTIVNNYNGKET